MGKKTIHEYLSDSKTQLYLDLYLSIIVIDMWSNFDDYYHTPFS